MCHSRCAIVGVPWRGSVSACLAWGDLCQNHVLKSAEKAEPAETPWQTYDGHKDIYLYWLELYFYPGGGCRS